MALFAAVFTLPLLFVGGSVTTYRVGLAVPDWPSTFGINMFLYDFWNAPFGVRVEHTHRLYGAAVGLATMGLTAWFLAFEPRRFMKILGVLALLAVIVQGILGGTRVTQVSTFLAAVHGCTAQAFFGLMVALCVLTGRDWQNPGPLAPDVGRLRRLGTVMLALVYAQIVLGAWFRHYGDLLALVLHAAFALAVVVHAILICDRVRRNRKALPWLVPSALCLALAVTLQVLLGMAAFVFLLPLDGLPHAVGFYQAVTRTGHQTNGALLLAASVVFVLRAVRHLRGAASDVERPRARNRVRRWTAPFGSGGRCVKTAVPYGHPGDCRPLHRGGPCRAWLAVGRLCFAHEAANRAHGSGHGGRRLPAWRPPECPPRHPGVHASGNGPGGCGGQYAQPVVGACAGRTDAPDIEPRLAFGQALFRGSRALRRGTGDRRRL